MKCPHCGAIFDGEKTKSQLHYEIVARHADGTRSPQEICDAINVDPEYAGLGLMEKNARTIFSCIRNANKHGHAAKTNIPKREPQERGATCWSNLSSRYYEAHRLWVEEKMKQREIAAQFGVSAGRISWMCRIVDMKIGHDRERTCVCFTRGEK